jgi:hypothetical protein
MLNRFISKERDIYSLLDPRDDKKIVYVGQTMNSQRRFKEHLRVKGENREKDKWIDELNTLGLLPVLKIERELICSQFHAFQVEMCITIRYRDLGYEILSVSKEKLYKIYCDENSL